jgi:hypothetical protein
MSFTHQLRKPPVSFSFDISENNNSGFNKIPMFTVCKNNTQNTNTENYTQPKLSKVRVKCPYIFDTTVSNIVLTKILMAKRLKRTAYEYENIWVILVD